MEKQLPTFKEKNPQLEVVSELIRGQHPHLKGFYSKALMHISNCIAVTFSTSSNWVLSQNFREQKPESDMCEEHGSRRYTSTCNQAKECIGKKGSQTEDKTFDWSPECSRYMDNECEILRCKIHVYEEVSLGVVPVFSIPSSDSIHTS